MRMVCYSIDRVFPFAINCWGNTCAKLLYKLQVKQNKLVRLVSNKTKRKTKLLRLYMANNVLKIRCIYKMEITKFMAKLLNKELPTIFYLKFQLCGTMHTQYTRSVAKKNLNQIRYVHSRTSNCISIAGVKIWNALPTDIREISAKYSFKKR